jgi:hypothetical protein
MSKLSSTCQGQYSAVVNADFFQGYIAFECDGINFSGL